MKVKVTILHSLWSKVMLSFHDQIEMSHTTLRFVIYSSFALTSFFSSNLSVFTVEFMLFIPLARSSISSNLLSVHHGQNRSPIFFLTLISCLIIFTSHFCLVYIVFLGLIFFLLLSFSISLIADVPSFFHYIFFNKFMIVDVFFDTFFQNF